MTYIADCEVFAYDWVFVFKNKETKEYSVFHNDYKGVDDFMTQEKPLLGMFNGKHYDQFILKAILLKMPNDLIKDISEKIIGGANGWQIPALRDSGIKFDQYDLMDDCQQGLSLKAFEGHMGMNIKESSVPFDLDRPLTKEELEETIRYCIADVDATDLLDDIRKQYLDNKRTLAREIGLRENDALYMTNAKLTAAYLKAEPPEQPWTDEREYQFPYDILWEYIPQEVVDFFRRIYDDSIPDEELWEQSLDIMVGDCPTRLASGGIHGCVDHYTEIGDL